jgi:hypothetical protein
MSFTTIANHFKEKFSQTSYPFKHSDKEFDSSEWIKIPFRTDRVNVKLQPFIIAISEIFRFEIGITQPEYRLADGYILSRKVKQENLSGSSQSRSLLDDWHVLTGNEKIFWEGMGRAVLVKYLFQENDFNIQNALIDKNNYFVAIDADKCFWKITEKYHYFRDVKILTYNNSPFPVTPFTAASGRPLFIVNNKKRSFIGDLHVTDYDNLPFLKHQYPSDWFFHLPQLKSYSSALTNDQRFLNEKHFAALKTLVTVFIKNILIELHIPDDKDKVDASSFVANQIEKFTQVCKQSMTFRDYLQKNGMAAMRAVLYEIHQFIGFNDYYRLGNSELQKEIEDVMCEQVIGEYSNLLKSFDLPGLTNGDESELKSVDSVNQVRDFYTGQLMEYHARNTSSPPPSPP